MIQDKDLKISLKELSLRGKKIIARQPAISYAEALAQVQRLKKKKENLLIKNLQQ